MRKLARQIRGSLVALAFLGVIVPLPLRAADNTLPRVPDVQLHDSGLLSGQVVDPNGRPLSGMEIELQRQQQPIARAMSNDRGQFAFHGLTGGNYVVMTNGTATACRCWAPHTAPPAAGQQLLIVDSSELARGQRPFGEIVTNPLVIGTIIAAAIAIPIAIHTSDSDGS